MTTNRLPLLFVAVLLLVGLGFLALAGYRALRPPVPVKPDLAAAAEEDLRQRGYRPLSGELDALLKDEKYRSVPTQAHPLYHAQAPDFALSDADGKPWRLADALAKGPVVLVFYYGYNCDHCVSQLFGLHKDVDKFREMGAAVVAVSPDARQRTQEQYRRYGAFDFAVLSDPDNAVSQKYGTFRPGKDGQEGTSMHGTFVISKQGKVTWANAGDEPFARNQTLLRELARAEGRPTGP